MRISTLLAAAGVVFALSAGAALSDVGCECCKDMAPDAEMKCCDEMKPPAGEPTPEPEAPQQAPAAPTLAPGS
ncbi:ammonium transporter family protein [Brevundimonas diminuta]|uniref:ammonium transporter family protein n=1 Tax=Brevundimonas diminuta TaxID=293 RepID=UPI001F5A86D0|nr:ammonium transporter family protein [Brevundimonas diminuta]